jgi:hypothetical protein
MATQTILNSQNSAITVPANFSQIQLRRQRSRVSPWSDTKTHLLFVSQLAALMVAPGLPMTLKTIRVAIFSDAGVTRQASPKSSGACLVTRIEAKPIWLSKFATALKDFDVVVHGSGSG